MLWNNNNYHKKKQILSVVTMPFFLQFSGLNPKRARALDSFQTRFTGKMFLGINGESQAGHIRESGSVLSQDFFAQASQSTWEQEVM